MKTPNLSLLCALLLASACTASAVTPAASATPAATSVSQDDPQADLYRFAEEGNAAAVKTALSKGAKLNGANEKGETALWFAVYGGQEDLALDLMKKGAKPEGVLKDSNECLLHYAAKAQLTKLAKVLKSKTPKCLSTKNSEGQTPSAIAKSIGDDKLAKLLAPKK